MRPRTLRRALAGVALGTLVLAIATAAHADEVGCCETECHATDAAGRATHSMQRRSMTQAACGNGSPGCETKWHATPCEADGGHAAVGVGAGVEPHDEADQADEE